MRSQTRGRRRARSTRTLAAGGLTAAILMLLLTVLIPSASASAAPRHTLPNPLDCKTAPTPEVPGRGVVGFFEKAPDTPPPPGDPFAEGSKTSIYEQYGYAGLRWNTYDLGCGPDVALSPDASVGTAVANWIIALPKAAVAATGAVLNQAFAPDFLSTFDPIISTVVETLRHAVFEQWFAVVVAAMGLLVIWKARQASLASTAAAIGWALLVMVVVTMVFRWPLVAGHAADATVTTSLGAVTGSLNDKTPGTESDAGTEAISSMHQALLYQTWLGGTFGDADSDVARRYGPVIFDATALTWREAATLDSDPAAGKKIIEAKEQKFTQAAQEIESKDPDAYQYLTGQRSDTRVGYAMLAGLATLCAVPFLFVAGLLVLGALVIVRFGVMLFPGFATLGLFPAMRSLVIGIGSTVAAAIINAIVFGIGAAVTVLAMGILLAPSTATPPWLDIILMLLLTVVMWVALRPFRRLTQMVSSQRNHFAAASEGVSVVGRSAARTSGRILSTALGTFLGVSATQRHADAPAVEAGGVVPQRSEAVTSYEPVTAGAAMAEGGPALQQPAALAGSMQVNAGSVTVMRTPSETAQGPSVEAPGEIYAPAGGRRATAGSRAESAVPAPVASVATGASSTATRVPMDNPFIGDDDSAPSGGRFETAGRPPTGGGAGTPTVSAPGPTPTRAAAAQATTTRQATATRQTPARQPQAPAQEPPTRSTVRATAAEASTSTYQTYDTDGADIGRPTDRGFRPNPNERDAFDLDELNEIFRPEETRKP